MMSSYCIQISAGQGPAECALAVRKFHDYLLKLAQKEGVAFEVLQVTPGPRPETLVSALIRFVGERAEALVEPYVGQILWVCQSPYRPYHRRKNWFIKVALLPPLEHENVALVEADLDWKTVRASGPGGQHVNKTETAVQVTHRPSGVQVTASESRSQHQNRKLAKEKLRACLYVKAEESRAQNRQQVWRGHHALERGNPVKRFKGRGFRAL